MYSLEPDFLTHRKMMMKKTRQRVTEMRMTIVGSLPDRKSHQKSGWQGGASWCEIQGRKRETRV